MGIKYLVYQKLITEEGSRTGSTPDALIPIRISPDETEYEVEPVEAKCPPTFANYISIFECETPMDLKADAKTNGKYYWQVLDQIDSVGALRGHLIAYHPKFRVGNLKHLVFDINQSYPNAKKPGGKYYPLHEDLKLLQQKKREAIIAFEVLRDKMITAG